MLFVVFNAQCHKDSMPFALVGFGVDLVRPVPFTESGEFLEESLLVNVAVAGILWLPRDPLLAFCFLFCLTSLFPCPFQSSVASIPSHDLRIAVGPMVGRRSPPHVREGRHCCDNRRSEVSA